MAVNSPIQSTLHQLLAGMILLAALACGGSGGGGGNRDSSNPTTPPTGAWSTAQILETNLLSDSYNPQVAVDASGRALVVWYRLSGPSGPADIWAKVYQPGVGWLPEGTIESKDGDARYPVVTVGGNGAFYVAWEHTPGGGNTAIWVERYIPGSGWSDPLQISDATTNSIAPVIAADGSGNAIVAWQQVNASTFNDVRASRFSVAGLWSQPVTLGTGPSIHNVTPLVAMDPNGNGMVTWNRTTDLTKGPYALCAVPYRTGLGWQIPAAVPSLQAGVEGLDDVFGCSVAMSSAGAVLGWTESLSGAKYRPCTRIWSPATGTWSAATTLKGSLDASTPEVGIDASGKVHAAWIQDSGLDWNDIFVASLTPGGAWVVSAQSVETSAGGIGYLSFQIAANGSGAMVWNQSNGTVASIFGARFEATHGWTTPTLLEANDAGAAFAPVVRLNPSGQAMATWYQKDAGGLRHIFANRWN